MYIISLQIGEDLLGFHIVFRLQCPDHGQLDSWHLLLDQAVDLNDLPGIFPDAKARDLRDQRASWIKAAVAQDLHAPVPGQEAVFDPERIDAQRNHPDMLWGQVLEDGGWRVET